MPQVPNPAIEKAIELAGSEVKLGEKLDGISGPAVHGFRKRGIMPRKRAQQTEALYGIPATELMGL